MKPFTSIEFSSVFPKVGVVIIGRNEGERLKQCLQSVVEQTQSVVYVDSGSTDGSVELAKGLGVDVVNLDMKSPFTAARARNAGIDHICTHFNEVEYIQFVDGDCEIEADWIRTASSVLDGNVSVVAAFGERRERFPEASKYNLICQLEWSQQEAGEVKSFGGDVMIRVSALEHCGGYNPDVIAAEDDELSIRLRMDGGVILKIACPMTIHDANMHTLHEWYRRAQRCGHAYANLHAIYGAPPENYFKRQFYSAILWGGVLPTFFVLATFVLPLVIFLALAIYGLQVIRIYMRSRQKRLSQYEAFVWGMSCVFSKIPESVGIVTYYWRRFRNTAPALIEYK